MVNVLPLIITDDRQAVATAIYYPFLMYRHMERLALRVQVNGPIFDGEPYGTIGGHRNVPYLDVTATCDPERRRLILGLINRHPERKARADVALRGFRALRPTQSYLLTGPDPLAANTLEQPDRVRVHAGSLPAVDGDRLRCEQPPCSVAVIVLE
jgi:alpha-N-arabinofuranosidase